MLPRASSLVKYCKDEQVQSASVCLSAKDARSRPALVHSDVVINVKSQQNALSAGQQLTQRNSLELLLTNRIAVWVLGSIWVYTCMWEVHLCITQRIGEEELRKGKTFPFFPYSVPYSLMQCRRSSGKKYLQWQDN